MTDRATAMDTAMAALRVSGQVLLVDAYAPPWGIAIPAGVDLGPLLDAPRHTRVVPFHIVRRGAFELKPDGLEPQVVRAGEAVICVGGQSHDMVEGASTECVPFGALLGGAASLSTSAPGATELVCGVFLLRSLTRNPLIDALPPVLHVDVSGRTGGSTLSLLTALLTGELEQSRAGKRYMASRFVELFCAEAIRQYVDSAAHETPGWLRAVRDPKIGEALNAVHASPGAPHSVASLAAGVNMSPSRFAARFREVMGSPAMGYVNGRRMDLACEQLATTDEAVERVAHAVGASGAALAQTVSEAHLWCGRPVKVFDGSTVLMSDTPSNQTAYPQHGNQPQGCGFPLARIVVFFRW